MVTSSSSSKTIKKSMAFAADAAASWYCTVALLALILIGSIRANSVSDEPDVRGSQLLSRPCDEIYVVGEGETLHTISDKCGDPFIVERNPHIHDPDDVFPGLVIKIIPSTDRIFYVTKSDQKFKWTEAERQKQREWGRKCLGPQKSSA